ncbi:hypothetical protein F183_A36350 [Bryobacterales bacterium F-183]|nr:hypothetical protein F183_A36350 [Bryobacterales bacterium F-183]
MRTAYSLMLFGAVGLLCGEPRAQQTIQKYCLGCHNDKLKSGGLVLDMAHQTAENLEKAVRRMRARHMPPVGLPRPDEATYDGVVTALEAKLDQGKPNPGRVDTFRRLNRTEYQNAIRDLLALDVDVSALLPPDDVSHGFDNITVGNLSPMLLERYLAAARKISRLAVGIAPKSPGGDLVTLPADLTQETHFAGLPLGTRGGTAFQQNFPVDAEYEIQIRLARDRNEHVEGLYGQHQIELLIDGERVKLFTVERPPAGKDHHRVDEFLKMRVPLKAGPHRVAATFLRKPAVLLETERQPYEAHFNMDRHPRVQPAVYSVSVNGPFRPTGVSDTPSRRRLLVCQEETDECRKKILSQLVQRAYRRSIQSSDLEAPIRFYREGGLEQALTSILVSPEFLFRIERDPQNVVPGEAYKISETELASRLSFFLWNSIPDDSLLDLAIAGKLRANLDTQVKRMLADPRARTLTTNFGGQWLYLRNLTTSNPDMRAYPGFDDNLRQAFRTETELFLDHVFQADRSVLELLNADYTYVNERLAKHYGIPHVYGSHFRRVTAPNRGGLLRHGSILTVTSYATRTSPVVRGKWIMENLLGAAPPPPPPNIPVLTEKRSTAGSNLTMRERISEHRRNPACSGCHNLIDPVGFALENYDGVGRWRTTEDSRPIDASGGLPDGSTFRGVAGLQQAILARPELFVHAFAEKLLTYGLGRGIEYYDQPAVRGIVRKAKQDNYRFSSFILGIVHSTPFQMRRPQT